METFSKTVADFLNELSHFTGRAPIFSIDFNKKELILVDAPSGFVNQLSIDSKWLTSLVQGKGIVLERFK